MKHPDKKQPGLGSNETGDYRGEFLVAPVSHIWLPRISDIDKTWNSKPWSQASFERELASPAARVRGVYVSGDLIGYLVAHVVLDEAHIVTLGIDPAWRRKGAGRVLLADFIAAARAEGVVAVTLEVRALNEAAQALYRSEGFVPAGLRREYYTNNGEDAVIMRLAL